MSAKLKLEEARELIRAGRNNEARDILETVDHPIAKEWLRKLNKVAPDTRKTNYYADSSTASNHPYEPHAHEGSEWMRSIQTAQDKLDTNHQKRVKLTKERRAKELKKKILQGIAIFIGIIVAIPLLCKPLYEFATRDIRPIAYTLGFLIFVGLPLRMIVRIGREEDARPGVIAGIVVAIVTGLILVLVEYGLFLRGYEVYTITFHNAFVTVFLRDIGYLMFNFEHFLLYLCTLVVVVPTVFATDDEFGEAVNVALRSGASAAGREFFR